jgi:hypothetical protein
MIAISLFLVIRPSSLRSEETFVRGVWHTPFSVASSVDSDHYCPDLDWDTLDSLGITHVITSVIRTGDCWAPVLGDIGERDLRVYANGWLIGDDDCYSNSCEDLGWYATSGYAMLDADYEIDPDSSCHGEDFYSIIHETGEATYEQDIPELVWSADPAVHDEGYLLKHYTGWDANWKWERQRYAIMTIKIADNTGTDPVARMEVWTTSDRDVRPPCNDVSDTYKEKRWEKELYPSDFEIAGEYTSFQTPSNIWGGQYKGNHDYRLYWYGNKEIWVDEVECRDTCSDRLFNFSDAEIEELKDVVDSFYDMNPNVLAGWYLNDEPFLNQLAPYDTVKTKIIDASVSGSYGVTTFSAVSRPDFFDRYLSEIENVRELAHDAYRIKGDGNCDGIIDTDSLSYPYNGQESVQAAYDTLAARYRKAKEAAGSAGVPFHAVIQVQAENRCSGSQNCYDRYGGWWRPTYRDPLAGEIKAQAYLALAYGAEGIWYFLYPSIYYVDDGYYQAICNYPDPPEWTYRGLIDRIHPDSTCYTEKNYKYDVVKGINDTLSILAPTLLDPRVEWDAAGSALQLPITGSRLIVDNIITEDPYTGGPDPREHRYIEVGIFSSTEMRRPDYLMVVNRRSAGRERREITLQVIKNPNRWYRIEDILSGSKALRESNSEGMFQYLFDLNPGYGRLLKITELKISDDEPSHL